MMRSSKSSALAWRSRRWYCGVGLGDGPLVVVALGDLRGVGLLVDELVLEVADLRREAARRVALRVEVEVAQDEAS